MSAHADAIAIRAATGDDAASIAPLLTSLGYPAAPADVRRRLDRLLADAAVRCLVATDGPNTIGFATLHILRIAHADDRLPADRPPLRKKPPRLRPKKRIRGPRSPLRTRTRQPKRVPVPVRKRARPRPRQKRASCARRPHLPP